jgi:arylsulfatase
MGLRYTRFHTTALCSPTRAALLTGRNHHSAGTGVITEIGDGYPGYSGQIPKTTAMFAEVLRQGGYSTAFIGKNHNIADWETSISGPYDRWPSLLESGPRAHDLHHQSRSLETLVSVAHLRSLSNVSLGAFG